jgi:DNA polymerase-1
MLFKIFQEKPDYLVVAWDAPVRNLRHDVFPEYKANRKKMDDDFRHQIPVTKRLTEELGIPSISIDGYEADDSIASIVRKFRANKDIIIDIYSSDKDLKQLLESNVFAMDPMKNTRMDTKLFLQEYLFEPEYILDYLSLVGDSADNIK